MSGKTALEQAKQMARIMLGEKHSPTAEELNHVAGLALGAVTGLHGDDRLDLQSLIRALESMYDVWVPGPTSLDDQTDHVEWLADSRAGIEWRFWNRYRNYLEDRLPPAAVDNVDEVTDELLKRLENPSRSGRWDRRGMVVGQVQSGKTANYTGLICKAADAGYRLIIVLAGSHNSLRSQTQVRLDHGFLGFDTQKRMSFDKDNVRLGVGRLAGYDLHIAHSLTSSEEKGDFTAAGARKSGVMIGGKDPVLLVVKKNASILRNLLGWATTTMQQHDPQTGRKMVKGIPLLLIDDEADNASINTKAIPLDEEGNPDPEHDPTTINSRIRELLGSFEQSAYVGYTATPFANIFIPRDIRAEKYGEDLFPRSFVVNLPVPSNYIGPAQVFGLNGDDGTDGPGARMPTFRPVEDQDNWVPNGHKNHHVPGRPPDSLHRAIRSFILVCAARMVRGDVEVHNSMLVHVTRYTSVQHEVMRQISEEVRFLRDQLRYGNGDASVQLREELRILWETDFVPTTKVIGGSEPPSWSEVDSRLIEASSRIEVRELNGAVMDTLQYSDYPNGLSVIAIGGDKLSRGLTLEGLSVSYYLRASRMYDTLMQMGRWFGYRPEYADLCRLYTTWELAGWYRDITAASEELREEFDRMAATGGTPADYGLLVRKHPGNLLITAATKMRHGASVQITFSGQISETVILHRDGAIIQGNRNAAERLLENLGEPAMDAERGVRARWHDVSSEAVLEFLDSYMTHGEARRAHSSLLAKYIRNRVADDELTHWTVGLASGQGEEAPLGGRTIRLVKRSSSKGPVQDEAFRFGRLVSPADETSDLTLEEETKAREETRRTREQKKGTWKKGDLPSGTSIRHARPPHRGLMLLYPLDPREAGLPDKEGPIIGLAISFPASRDAPTIDYMANQTYWEQEFAL